MGRHPERHEHDRDQLGRDTAHHGVGRSLLLAPMPTTSTTPPPKILGNMTANSRARTVAENDGIIKSLAQERDRDQLGRDNAHHGVGRSLLLAPMPTASPPPPRSSAT